MQQCANIQVSSQLTVCHAFAHQAVSSSTMPSHIAGTAMLKLHHHKYQVIRLGCLQHCNLSL